MPKLINPDQKPKLLAPVHPNVGIAVAYRTRLERLIARMQRSILYWIRARYRANPPKLAQDASPAIEFIKELRTLGACWMRKFDQAAQDLGKWFAQDVFKRSDNALRTILKDAGWVVKFRTSRTVNDTMQATIGAQVSLIKSIGQQHLTDVQGIVMRSVQEGRQIGWLTDELQKRYDLTRKRATLIARDQNNKATATITRVRQQELGITKAIWMHSGGGREPRPKHVAFAAGKLGGPLYDISKGAEIADKPGECCWPGTLINCLPGNSVIELATGCKKLWRRSYSGKLAFCVTESGKTIEATPNHPILTKRGWLPIKAIDLDDDIISISSEVFNGIEKDIKTYNTSISQVFDAISDYIRPTNSRVSSFEFHGDTTNEKVDTVDIDCFLPSELNGAVCKIFMELFLTRAYHMGIGLSLNPERALYAASLRLFSAPERLIRIFCSLLSLLARHQTHADDVSFGAIAKLNTCFLQTAMDCPAVYLVFSRQLKGTDPGAVFLNNQIYGQLFNFMSRALWRWNYEAFSAEFLGQNIGSNIYNSSGFLEKHSLFDKGSRVIETGLRDFRAHVYNLETQTNWYTSNAYLYHNCRCVSRPVIPGLEHRAL